MYNYACKKLRLLTHFHSMILHELQYDGQYHVIKTINNETKHTYQCTEVVQTILQHCLVLFHILEMD